MNRKCYKLSSVTCRLYYIFQHSVINGEIKKHTHTHTHKQNVCFDFLYNFCLKHIIVRRTE